MPFMHINKQSTSQRKTENCIHFLNGHFSNTALELINVPQFLWQPAGGTRPKGDRYSFEKEDNENGA